MKRIHTLGPLLAFTLAASSLFASPGAAATHYMPSGCANLAACFSVMSPGDTLEIADGTYTGASNRITQTQRPPDGTSKTNFTTVKAAHDGKVFFDGQNADQMFFLQMYSSPFKVNYLAFQGINWIRNAGNGVLLTSNGGSGNNNQYIKFVRCGAQGGSGGSGNWDMNYTDNLLLEECFSFGDSRYGIIAFGCNKVVIRRCVVRLDAAHSSLGYPIAGIQIYDTQYAEIQNCIVLDIDDAYFGNFSESEGAFDTHKFNTRTTQYVSWRGNIALNIKMSRPGPSTGWTSTAGGYVGGTDVSHSNTIMWGLTSGIALFYPGGGSNLNVDHATIGASSASALGVGSTVTNNIFTRLTGTAIAGASGINYNDFSGNGSNGSTGSNARTVDPVWSASNATGALKYLPRIETGSSLSGQGSGGSDIGASVLYRTGTDGTFYGDVGFNTLTGIPLWPFPHEATVKSVMAAYSVSGGPSGTRGFAASGNGLYGGPKTLTSYIWEYLGNACPPEVCGTGTADTTPPSVPGSPAAVAVSSSQINLTWTASTDNVGIAGYRVYRGGQLAGTATGSSYQDTGLAASTAYTYSVTAFDAAQNASSPSATVTESTLAADAVPPTAPGGVAASPQSSSSIALSWTAASDNVGVTGYRVYRGGALVGTVTGLSFTDTGLTPDTSYSYYAVAFDGGGNSSAASGTATARTLAMSRAGLVAAYGFNEGSGTSTADLSGNNNAGALTGTTWTTSGKFGAALSFNGTSSMVTVADASPLRLTSAMTVEAWVYPASLSSWRNVLIKEQTSQLAYALYANSDADHPTGHVYVGGDMELGGTSKLPLNTWSHLAATYDGATLRLFVNGTEVSSRAVSGSLSTSTNPLRIGGNAVWGEYFNGRIDEVRVYSRALSAGEVALDMNAPVAAADATPPQNPRNLR